MEHWTETILLVVALLVAMTYLIYAYKDTVKELPVFKIKKAWQNLQSFERHLVKAGFILFIPIPFIKNHILSDSHLFEFFVELFPALASAMLITGIMALIREIHRESTDIRDNDEEAYTKPETSKDAH